MRLWQKIFLPALALMVAITALSSILLLRNSTQVLWQREFQRAVTQQQYLAGMLRAGVISHRLQLGVVLLEEKAAQDTAVQVLKQQALGDYLAGLSLVGGGGESLYAQLPDGITLPEGDDESSTVCQLQSGEEPGEWFLVCSMPVNLESSSCRLGAAYRVSDLQKDLNAQAVWTVGMCLGISLAAAAILLILVRLMLRPLAALDASARRIAGGSYSERLETSGSDELSALAGDMNALAQAVQDRVGTLERVAQERKVFIANLAHEMKTPLTSILGYADLLYLPKAVSQEKRTEYAGIILEEARRLRGLSGKLMELITVGSANLILSPIDLSQVVQEVSISLQPALEQSGLTLEADCPSAVLLMDRELFKSLLYNLLDNGRKASARGGHLALAAQVEEGHVILLIRDWGRGIPKEELDKVCQPFYMVDKSRSRKAGGAGLGLALCQEIVSAHHGTMELDSRLGQGTLVTLRFPLAPKEKEVTPYE